MSSLIRSGGRWVLQAAVHSGTRPPSLTAGQAGAAGDLIRGAAHPASPRAEAKKKTNTFYRINPETPIYPYIFSMLRIFKDEPPGYYPSELVDRPLDRLCLLAGRGSSSDPMLGRELDAAMELIGEVFSVGGDEVKRMIKERMESRGMIRGRRREMEDGQSADGASEAKRKAATEEKMPRQQPQRRKRIKESADEDTGL